MNDEDRQTTLNEQTRSIFLVQHNKYLQDEVLSSRFLKMVSDPAYDQLTAKGFEEPERCRRYVKRENIRKFFAPLHYDSSSRWRASCAGPAISSTLLGSWPARDARLSRSGRGLP